MKKRILSIALSLCMLLTLLPLTALAVEDVTIELTQENIEYYAIDNGFGGKDYILATGSYKLMEDITVAYSVNIGDVSVGQNVELDLNGKTLTKTGSGNAIVINGDATFELNDSSAEKTGTIKAVHDAVYVGGRNSTFIMNGGSLYGMNGIHMFGVNSNTTVNGGTVKGSDYSIYGETSIISITLNGGIYYGDTYIQGGESTINGSRVSFMVGENEYAWEVVSEGGKATEPIEPENGLLTFKGWYTDVEFTNEYEFDEVVTGALTLYGKFGVIELTQENIEDYAQDNGFWKNYVLTTGSYKLMEDITVADCVYIGDGLSTGQNVELDLNGNTLTKTGSADAIFINYNSTFELNDSSAGKTGTVKAEENIAVHVAGENSAFTMNGGSLEGVYGIGSTDVNSNATVNGGTVKGSEYSIYSSASVTLNGGIYYGDTGGVITINGSRVSFMVGENEYAWEVVPEGGKATEPIEPENELLTFKGWYTDVEFTTEYEFDEVVTGALTLYGKFGENHVDDNTDHECDYCGEPMGTHEPANENTHICEYCGKAASDHTGGSATCAKKAVCEICGESYGEKNPEVHEHIAYVTAKKPTAWKDGNIEYWYCVYCGKYYSDADCTEEITRQDTVIVSGIKYGISRWFWWLPIK